VVVKRFEQWFYAGDDLRRVALIHNQAQGSIKITNDANARFREQFFQKG